MAMKQLEAQDHLGLSMRTGDTDQRLQAAMALAIEEQLSRIAESLETIASHGIDIHIVGGNE